jgi:SAM-dependent methyltransferase
METEPVMKRIVRNSEYDPFARVYNRHWGRDYRAEALPIVERLLLARLQPGAAVLDVCCGTGQFTQEIRLRGYDVVGIDASGEMIGFARQNAPGASLAIADAREFSLGRKFDAAYSVFESLNHIPDQKGLMQVFRCVRRHLKPRAPFLFDLNREQAFILYWNTVDALVANEDVCILRMEYDEETRGGACHMTAFRKDSVWEREDFTIRQTCHDDTTVQEALHEAGFRDVTAYDARDAGMEGDAGYARTFYLVTR